MIRSSSNRRPRNLLVVAVPVAKVIVDRLVDLERLQGGMAQLVLAAEMPNPSHQALADSGRLLVLRKAAEAGLWRPHGLDGGPEAFPVRRGQRHHSVADISRVPAE